MESVIDRRVAESPCYGGQRSSGTSAFPKMELGNEGENSQRSLDRLGMTGFLEKTLF